MLKVSTFLSETEFGRTAVPLFGPADGFFEKTASVSLLPEVLKYVETLRPQNGSQYVLVNALGAGEFFSSNVNGDFFNEAGLIHKPDDWKNIPLLDRRYGKTWPYGFPTFYDAHPFAHHRNKDPTRAYGEVELATWNDKMKRVELVARVDHDKCERFGGMGVWDRLKEGQYADVSMGTRVPYDLCFPRGTLIRTALGQKAIEEILIGDRVRTHTGAVRAVTGLMGRVSSDLVAIHTSGLPRIKATGSHPFLVIRKEQARSCRGWSSGERQRHILVKGQACSRCGAFPELSPAWAAAETLRPGDYFAVPVSTSAKSSEDEVTPKRARLLGYYLGDGYILRQRTGKGKDGEYRDMGVGFSVGSTESSHLQRLLATISEADVQNGPRVYESGEGRKALIVSLFDQGLAAWLQRFGGRTSRGKYLAEEVFAWSREAKLELVAGYIDTDGSCDVRGQVRIGSVNRGLLLDVQRLLLAESITATVCFAGTVSTGFGVGTESWYLVLSTAQAQKFVGRSEKVVPIETTGKESPQSFFWEGYWYTPIKSIKELDQTEETFNFSVETDESYIAEGRAAHNCSITLDKKLYQEALATYDPKKHKHPGAAALEFHKRRKAKNGTGIRGLSITRADYSKYCLEQMNQILPDGRKVFVYNDYPRFFDISFVFIGADRTAKVMIYIAQNFVMSSNEAAEKLGYVEGVEKAASISDQLLDLTFKRAALKRGEIDKDVTPNLPPSKAVPLLTRSEPDLSGHAMDALSAVPLGNALSTTTGLGIVLRPREFQKLILKKMGKGDLADSLERRGILFPASDEETSTGLKKEDFMPALARKLLSEVPARSGLGPIIHRRVVVIACSTPRETEKTSSLSDDLLRKMGAAYNGYRREVQEFVTNAQDLFRHATSSDETELCKVASVSPEEISTPLSRCYFETAFKDELPGKSEGAEKVASIIGASVQRVPPSRTTWM